MPIHAASLLKSDISVSDFQQHHIIRVMNRLSSKPFMRSRQATDGFSLMEVLISVLMISGFLATAMQALISATAIKVRSEEISEATTWMQEDLESLKFEANRLDFDPDPAVDDYIAQNSDCGTYATALIARINQPRNPSLAGGVIVSPAPPYANDRQPKESSIGDRAYILKRELDANDNMLAITHSVHRDLNQDGSLSPAEEANAIGELYSEIIPDVAFYCDPS